LALINRFQIIASFSSIVEFVKIVETEFAMFEIKKVHLEPKIAEDKYERLLHLNLEGWLLSV